MPGRSKALLPEFIPPQLTKSVERAPAGDAWLHEIKFDGYRLHARIADKQAKLLTRTGLDWTAKYEPVAIALAKLSAKAAYIDGEVCAVRADGSTNFADLQAATDHKESARLIYFAFDLLFLDGEDLQALPLLNRKNLLKSLLRRVPKNIQFVDHVISQGQAFYDATCKHDAEGIVSKRVVAPYKPGGRGVCCTVKCINEDEFVFVGFTYPEGRRPYLRALLSAIAGPIASSSASTTSSSRLRPGQ